MPALIQRGDSVYLRACRGAGEPGTVVRAERGRLVVYWADMDYWSRHRPEALEIALQGIRDAKRP
jgi:hypothetical protein